MSITLVQGDTGIAIRGVITDNDTGSPLNLTGSSVYFQMRQKDDKRYAVNAACTIVDPVAGTVRYITATNDLNTAGTYLAQFEVHYPDTSIQTTDPQVTIEVRRQ